MGRDKVAVIYHSQSAGNTQAAAGLVAEGLREAGGFEVVMHNTNETRVDPALLAECAAVALGTPDYFSYPAGNFKQFVDDWLIACRQGNEDIQGMPIALFLTHGGGGRAREPFEGLCGRIGSQVGETVMVKGMPDTEASGACRELGRALGAAARDYAGGEG